MWQRSRVDNSDLPDTTPALIDSSLLDFLTDDPGVGVYSQSAGPEHTYRSDLEPDTDGASEAPELVIP